jgi:hypothetical protein
MGGVGSLMQVKTILKELGVLDIHLSVENRNLRVRAQPGTLTDVIKASIAEHKEAIISCLEETLPLDHWHQLAASTLSDTDVTGLDEAMFLFAYRMIQKAHQTELAGIWKRYSPYLKKRQPGEAFRVVERLFESRLKAEH